MKSTFPPLYPQEAYFEQNNLHAFSTGSGNNFGGENPGSFGLSNQNKAMNFDWANQNQNQNINPLTSLFGGMGGGQSALLPILLKMMSGASGASNMSEDLGKMLMGGSSGDNPLMGLLSNLGQNKKNSPPMAGGEKEFPDN